MDPIGNKPYGFYGLSMVLQCHMNILKVISVLTNCDEI